MFKQPPGRQENEWKIMRTNRKYKIKCYNFNPYYIKNHITCKWSKYIQDRNWQDGLENMTHIYAVYEKVTSHKSHKRMSRISFSFQPENLCLLNQVFCPQVFIMINDMFGFVSITLALYFFFLPFLGFFFLLPFF